MKYQFIPHNSLIYRTAVRFGHLGRYVCTVLCLVILGCCWFYAVYRPITRLANETFSYVLCTQELIEHVNAMQKKSAETKTMLANLSTHQILDADSISHEQQAQQTMAKFFEKIPTLGFTVLSYNAEQSIYKPFYAVHKFQIIFLGKFTLLSAIFDFLLHNDISIVPTHISYLKKDGNGGTITATMQIITYGKRPLNLEQAEGLGG